jgi:epoxyqueuosine reductase QueG
VILQVLPDVRTVVLRVLPEAKKCVVAGTNYLHQAFSDFQANYRVYQAAQVQAYGQPS